MIIIGLGVYFFEELFDFFFDEVVDFVGKFFGFVGEGFGVMDNFVGEDFNFFFNGGFDFFECGGSVVSFVVIGSEDFGVVVVVVVVLGKKVGGIGVG